MYLTKHQGRSGLRAAFFFFLAFFPALPQSAPSSDTLAEQSRHGKELMSQGRFEEAATVYRQMVKALPSNVGLLLNLGLAEQMSGHPDLAVPRFEGVLRSQPNSIPALSSLGMSHLQMNHPDRALAPLRKVVLLDPKDVNARGMLAGAELSLGHFSEAVQQYRQLTSLASPDPKAWFGLGKSYEGMAAQNFEQLSKLDEQSGYVALLLAEARVQQRQYRSAFFFYREAEKKTPQLPGLHSGLAHVYRNTGHEDWAAIEEQREADLSAEACKTAASPACRFIQGYFLSVSERTGGDAATLFWKTRADGALAIQSFDQLGKLPESVELHALKAQMLHDHRQDLEASQEWKAALVLTPGQDDPRLKFELATSLFIARDYQSAIPALLALLKNEPQDAELNFMLGESLWRTQQAEQAISYLNRAIKQKSDLLPAHAAIGLALASLGKNAEAALHLEKALALDDDGSLHYSLARAYQATGDTEKAKTNLAEYSRIQKKNNEVSGLVAAESEITAPLNRVVVRMAGFPPQTIFYDGHCGLSHHAVAFLLRLDREKKFRFAPAGGLTYQRLTSSSQSASLRDSMVVRTREGRLITGSDSWIHVFTELGGIWRIVAHLMTMAPQVLREAVYDFVARTRYSYFGRRTQPYPEVPSYLRDRFDG